MILVAVDLHDHDWIIFVQNVFRVGPAVVTSTSFASRDHRRAMRILATRDMNQLRGFARI